MAAYSLPETVEGKATAGRGAALGLQGGREARVGLRGGSRLMELARQEQVACVAVSPEFSPRNMTKSPKKGPVTEKRGPKRALKHAKEPCEM